MVRPNPVYGGDRVGSKEGMVEEAGCRRNAKATILRSDNDCQDNKRNKWRDSESVEISNKLREMTLEWYGHVVRR